MWRKFKSVRGGRRSRFCCSKVLTRRIADYILFEGQNPPQLTFVLIEEP